MKMWVRNLLLAVLAIGLVAVPLLFVQGAEWGATDGRNTEAIQELQPDYEPWFQSIFSPADLGIEPYMFGLQALLGSLALSAAMGWLIGRTRVRPEDGQSDLRVAGIVVAVGLVVAVVLLFVETEFGELQAFKTALQGLAVGFLGFFPGYLSGRRGAVARLASSGQSLRSEPPSASTTARM